MLALHSEHHALLAHVADLRQPGLGGEPVRGGHTEMLREARMEKGPQSGRETRRLGSIPEPRAPSRMQGRDTQRPLLPPGIQMS